MAKKMLKFCHQAQPDTDPQRENRLANCRKRIFIYYFVLPQIAQTLGDFTALVITEANDQRRRRVPAAPVPSDWRYAQRGGTWHCLFVTPKKNMVKTSAAYFTGKGRRG